MKCKRCRTDRNVSEKAHPYNLVEYNEIRPVILCDNCEDLIHKLVDKGEYRSTKFY